jgi:RNA polymerase sigma-70 factor (ECF subfamily)
VANLEGWFTTIVGRVCLDMLRSRRSRREDPLDPDEAAVAGPEQEAMLADSVGLALLVVLDTLPPAERVAFVLHDTFGLPFGEIASITGRSPAAARQLASRGRRRIQGTGPDADPAAGARVARQRKLTEAFLAASRGGDLAGLISVLDPDVVLHSDAATSPSGVPITVRGAAAVAGGAKAASARSRYGRVALVNGAPGLIMAPRGRLLIALAFTFSGDRISQIDVIGDPDRLAALDLALLD